MTKNRWILLGLWSMVWLGCDTALADEMKRVASELEGIPEVSIWTDLSVRFLSQIFGQVVYLPGFDSNHPLLSALFWAFNIGVLGLLAVRIGWNIITQTLLASTAGDQISTKIKPMTTIRSLGGILLLLPGSSGYSMVQVLMLTIVVQGVGLANIMWSASVDIIKGNNGQFIVAQHTNKQDGSFDPDKQKFDDIRSLVGDLDKFRRMNATKTSQLLNNQENQAYVLDIFAAAVCAQNMYLHDRDQLHFGSISPEDYGYFITKDKRSIMFGSRSQPRACGQIGINSDYYTALSIYQKLYNQMYTVNVDDTHLASDIETVSFNAMQAMVSVADLAARQWVNKFERSNRMIGDDFTTYVLNHYPKEEACFLNDSDDSKGNPAACQMANAMVAAATDAYAKTLNTHLRIKNINSKKGLVLDNDTLNKLTDISMLNDQDLVEEIERFIGSFKENTQDYEAMREGGWAYAGIHFNRIMMSNARDASGHKKHPDEAKDEFPNITYFMPVIQYSIPNPGGGQVDFGADEPVDDYTYYQLLAWKCRLTKIIL